MQDYLEDLLEVLLTDEDADQDEYIDECAHV